MTEPPTTTQDCRGVIPEIPSHVWENSKYRVIPESSGYPLPIDFAKLNQARSEIDTNIRYWVGLGHPLGTGLTERNIEVGHLFGGSHRAPEASVDRSSSVVGRLLCRCRCVAGQGSYK